MVHGMLFTTTCGRNVRYSWSRLSLNNYIWDLSWQRNLENWMYTQHDQLWSNYFLLGVIHPRHLGIMSQGILWPKQRRQQDLNYNLQWKYLLLICCRKEFMLQITTSFLFTNQESLLICLRNFLLYFIFFFTSLMFFPLFLFLSSHILNKVTPTRNLLRVLNSYFVTVLSCPLKKIIYLIN